MFALLFVIGMLSWSLAEYLLHGHVFHFVPNPDSPQSVTLHFFLHGQHHKFPRDKGIYFTFLSHPYTPPL